MPSWEPFSEAARQGIVAAQQFAERIGTPYLDAEHLLVGALEVGNNPAVEALNSLGIAVSVVTVAVERTIERGSGGSDEMTFTGRAKRLIEQAFEESRALNHQYVGAEHIVLAYLDVFGENSAALRDAGVNTGAFREKIVELVSGTPPKRARVRGVEPSRAPSARLTWDRVMGEIEMLDSPGQQSATDVESERRLYYIDDEDLWRKLQASVGRRDLPGTLLYAFILNKRSAREPQEVVRDLLERLQQTFTR